ncbi:MAG: ABC transporter permease [Polyangiales bacterium]
MSFFVLVREAVRAVLRHTSRSALAVLGITIGIAAVVWVVAIGRAGAQRSEEQLRALGDNLVWVEAGSRNVAGVRTGTHGTTSLTLEDANAIRDEVSRIMLVSPQIDGSGVLISSERNWAARYRGIAPSYLAIKRWEIAEGNAFTDDDVDHAAAVCLIGQTVRDKLFGKADAVGELVRIGINSFEVVGVLAPKGQTATGQDQDDTVMLPYTTVQKRLRGRGYEWLDDIMRSADSASGVAVAAAQISALLRERHQIRSDADDDFNIRHPEEIIKAQLEAAETYARLLIAIAAVALLVGGIGVMNVMLASVAERTREIGLRRAVGAQQGAVQVQFITEAIVLTGFGGLLGIGISLAGAVALERLLGWPMPIPPQAFVLALSFSIGVGVTFGFYPAWRASRLDPIEALRSE